MAYKDLTFLLFAKDMSASRGFEKVAASGDAMSKGISGSMGLAAIAVAGLAISITAKSVKMAADFQTATTRLVTDAGESASALGQVSQGILDVSVSTGTGAQELATGMYYIESAGYHGAAGLDVLKAAAEGAKVGGADLKTTADALTTVMKDYGPAAGTATQATDALIATVSHGKTTLEDLAGSLHNVLPNAQALGIGLDDVLGALASMTQEGISADQASQNLNHTIVSLANPTSVMANEMSSLGLNSTKVAAQLGKRGITGTLDELSDAITKKMGPSGLVVENIMANSANATALANAEFKKLPTSVQQTATAFKANAITNKVWTASLQRLSPEARHLAQQWATNEKNATGFSKALSSGTGPMHTYTADLAKVTGGQVGLQVALHLTALHAADVTANVKAIGKASKDTKKDVADWDKTQGTFNQKMSVFDSEVQSVGIELGSTLLPVLGHVADAATTLLQVVDAAQNPLGHFNQIVNTTTGELTPLGLVFESIGYDVQQTIKQFSDLGSVGAHIVSGLVTGIEGRVGDVVAAATKLANAIPAPIRKILGIASPSKVMQQLMTFVGQGAVKGLLGSTSQVSAAASTMATAIRSAFSDKQISKSAEQSALADVKAATDANSKLASLAKQRAAVQATLANLKTSRTGVHDDVLSATTGYGDVTGFGPPGDAVQGLHALVTKTKTFTADLKSLSKKGISNTLLTQLVNGWDSDPDTALSTANGLLANPTDLKQILSLNSQLATAGASLGSYAAHSEYDSQINAAAGKSKVLTWEMQKTAEAALKKEAKELHVHLHLSGTYAGTKIELAKTLKQAIQDGIKSGVIPKNWATG